MGFAERTFAAKDEPTFECVLCLDEPHGWRLLWCRGHGPGRANVYDRPSRATGMAVVDCGRFSRHTQHTFTARCECHGTNSVAARARERMNVSRQKQATKEGR